jgi:fibro-slime domain-containing protein
VKAVIRDFRGWASSASDPGGAADKHPDFEPAVKTAETGIAASTLGSDQEPVFGNTPGIQTVTSADTFAQWYHDVDGVNMRFEITLPLTPDPNDPKSLAYNNQTYFPIDNEGWGNQGQTHNYSFTTEIHTTFTYKGGESFTFIGDDDVFVYVNNQQVIDLGGIHNAETGIVNFDQQAAALGLTVGQTYNMDIFHAERHVTESHFRMETKFECLTSYIIPIQ